jgi:hypothetical protein
MLEDYLEKQPIDGPVIGNRLAVHATYPECKSDDSKEQFKVSGR